jgi:hypothetical protein
VAVATLSLAPPKLGAAVFVHRTLRHVRAFKAMGSDLPAKVFGKVPDGQTVLGIYENVQGSLEDCVVVTDRSVLLHTGGKLEEIRYSDIASTTWTPECKQEACALRVTMRDGIVKLLPLRGRNGRFADVFEFVRFMNRVVADGQ